MSSTAAASPENPLDPFNMIASIPETITNFAIGGITEIGSQLWNVFSSLWPSPQKSTTAAASNFTNSKTE